MGQKVSCVGKCEPNVCLCATRKRPAAVTKPTVNKKPKKAVVRKVVAAHGKQDGATSAKARIKLFLAQKPEGKSQKKAKVNGKKDEKKAATKGQNPKKTKGNAQV